MKKVLLLLCVVFVFMVSVCFAFERPRWVGQPIYVYVPQYGQMSTLMKQAFMAWEQKSKSTVRFSFVDSPSNANIEVEFVDFAANNCNNAQAAGCTKTSTRGGNYYKALVTIGTKEYMRKCESGQCVRKIVTRPKENIYGVMLHEAGHAIGLGHSDVPKSVMYPYDLDTMQFLTNEDLKLLYRKYH